jgi:hypothetical protein
MLKTEFLLIVFGEIEVINNPNIEKQIIALRCEMNGLSLKDYSNLEWANIQNNIKNANDHDEIMVIIVAFLFYCLDNQYKIPLNFVKDFYSSLLKKVFNINIIN